MRSELTCAACDEPLAEPVSECPHCGNNPEKFIRNAAVALVVGGAIGTIFHFLVGVLLVLFAVAALIGVWWKDYPATEYAFN